MGTGKRIAEELDRKQFEKTCQICGLKCEQELGLEVKIKRQFLEVSELGYSCVCNTCVLIIQNNIGKEIKDTIECDIRGERERIIK